MLDLPAARRDQVAAWSSLADAADATRPLSIAGLRDRLRQRLGRKTPELDVRAEPLHDDATRWTVSVRGMLPQVVLHGIASTTSAEDALQRTVRYAHAIRDLQRTEIAGPRSQWAARLARLRSSAAGLVSNPRHPEAPELDPRLLDLVRRGVGADLASWMASRAAELGAAVFNLRMWTARYPSGWQTFVQPPVHGEPGRKDVGQLSPLELLDLPVAQDQREVASGPPGFERWPDRHQLRDPADVSSWEGTIGTYTPLEWNQQVSSLRRTGQANQVVLVKREFDGSLVLDSGAAFLRMAVEAGLPTVWVWVMYAGDSARFGLVLDPVSGVWNPYPPGRHVHALLPDADRRRRGLHWQPSIVVKRERTSDGQTLVTLANGAVVAPRQLALVNTAQIAPVARPNPARAQRALLVASPDGSAVEVRRAHGQQRLLRTLPEAHLQDAQLVRGADGAVLGAEGWFHEAASTPTPRGRWARVSLPAPNLRLYVDGADEVGQPGLVWMRAHDRPLAGALSAAGPRTNRGVGQEVVIDAEGRKYTAVYQVVEANVDGDGALVVSHQPANLDLWTPGYPPQFQTRDLGSLPEQQKIRAIARTLDPVRLLHPHLDLTLGPPVAWESPEGRLYALGGNGRTIAILIAPEDRYEAYVEAGRRMYACWPRQAARPGHRWVLVRVVSGLDMPEAVQLAAASQLSTSAEEGRIGKALGLVRSLALDLSHLPPIMWTAPISAANVDEFAVTNRAFVHAVTNQMDPAKRSGFLNDSDRLGPLMAAVMLGFLPEPVRRAGLFTDPKTEDALMGALPTMVTLRGRIGAGEVWPEFDLLNQLPGAIDVFQFLRHRRLSFKQLHEAMDAERRTARLAHAERISDINPLAFALAGVLYNAARRTAPEDVAAGILAQYLDAALTYDPRQRSMFGSPKAPDPAPILAALVPGFQQGQAPAPDAPEPPAGRGLFGNPRRRREVARLSFDRSRYPSGSDCRSWCKQAGFHPGVPQVRRDFIEIEQKGGQGTRVVPAGPGVWAHVRG